MNYAGISTLDSSAKRDVSQSTITGAGFECHIRVEVQNTDVYRVNVSAWGSATRASGTRVHTCVDAQGTLGLQTWALPLRIPSGKSVELTTRVVKSATGSGIADARLSGPAAGRYADGLDANFLLELGGLVPENSDGSFHTNIMIQVDDAGSAVPLGSSCTSVKLSSGFVGRDTTVRCSGLTSQQSVFLLASWDSSYYPLDGIGALGCSVYTDLMPGQWQVFAMTRVGAEASVRVFHKFNGPRMTVQGVVMDPAANALGLTTTEGLQISFDR